VADKVIRYAHCPVLIARPIKRTGRILVATDLSEPSFPAVAAAVREARRTGAALTILHCIEGGAPTNYGFELPGMLPSVDVQNKENERLHRKIESRLEEVLARHEMTSDRRVVAGSPAASIVSVCDELRPDLLVVGTRGRTGLRRVILGSVAEAVARLAPCSVLIVRRES
jgi:nucleotide-binding universal stress UspA family protein